MTAPLDEARLRELAEAARKYLAGHDIKADGYGSQVWGQSLKGGDAHIADIRGWGYLTGRGGGLALSEEDGIAAQRAVQEYLVAAWNAVPHLLDALSAERERAEYRIAEAYQVIGAIADAGGLFNHPDVQRALTYFSEAEPEGEILPFSLAAEKAGGEKT